MVENPPSAATPNEMPRKATRTSPERAREVGGPTREAVIEVMENSFVPSTLDGESMPTPNCQVSPSGQGDSRSTFVPDFATAVAVKAHGRVR
jgi:hypothetical protein